MLRPARLLPLLVIGLAMPAHAQMSLSLDSSASAPGGGSSLDMSVSAPDEASSSSSSVMQVAPSVPPPNGAPSSDEVDDEGDDLDEGDSIEPVGPPVNSREALSDFFAACNTAAGGVVGSTDQLHDAGWADSDTTDAGPFTAIYSGYREFGGLGEVDIWGAMQTFPSQRLGYCRVDFSDVDGIIDFKDMAGLGELTGSVEDRGADGVFGTWESADKHVLVLASRVDGSAQVEFNFLLGDTPKP